MRNAEAIMGKGKKVRVSGYKPARVGVIVGLEWLGGRKKGKAMYVRIDFGQPMPNHADGVISYKAKYLTFTEGE